MPRVMPVRQGDEAAGRRFNWRLAFAVVLNLALWSLLAYAVRAFL